VRSSHGRIEILLFDASEVRSSESRRAERPSLVSGRIIGVHVLAREPVSLASDFEPIDRRWVTRRGSTV
jgi:hypothetical protein